MDYEMKLKQELYDKLEKEYNDFIEDLKTKKPDEIINKSYEKVMKEELKEMFYPELNNYELSELKALNKTKAPLEELYQGWMDYDGGVHEPLQYSIEDTLEFLKKEQQKNRNKSMEGR